MYYLPPFIVIHCLYITDKAPKYNRRQSTKTQLETKHQK